MKIYEKDLQTLLEIIKLVEKHVQQVTADLASPTVNMMLNKDWCFVCGKSGHIGHCCPNAHYYNCEGYGHFAQDCPDKIPHQEHRITMTGHASNPIGTDPSQLRTDTAKEGALTCQYHTTETTMAEASATIGGTHPTTVAAHNTIH